RAAYGGHSRTPGWRPHPAPWPAMLFPCQSGPPEPASRSSTLLAHSHGNTRSGIGRHTGAALARLRSHQPVHSSGYAPAPGEISTLFEGSPVPCRVVLPSEPVRVRATGVLPPQPVPGNRLHGQLEPLAVPPCRQGTPGHILEWSPAASSVAHHRAARAGARG